MYKSILGKEGFRQGLRLYMERNDGTGATCDDFRNAMADANDVDFDQFALWYSTAGTPTVSYKHSYDKQLKTFSLTLTQSLENTPDVLLHIPVSVGLLDKESGGEVLPTTTLELKKRTETFEFKDLEGDVIPSILRDFSAPVILVSENGADEEDSTLGFLATYDTDGFNRWEAIQKLYAACIFAIMRGDEEAGGDIQESVFNAFENTLNDQTIDPASKSYLLNLPTESILSRQLEVENPGGVHRARQELGRRIHHRLHTQLMELYDEVTASIPDGAVRTDTQSRATRALRNVLLDFLCYVGDDNDERKAAATLAMKHLDDATCLTDRLAAFRKLTSMSGVAADARDEATKKFYLFAKENDPIVMHKWFQTQALSDLSDALDRVKVLTQHPDFKATNAGRFRSLVTSFTMNARAFHDESGEGYKFIGSVITQMDAIAPQLAIELANKLAPWRRHDDSVRASMMKAELKRIASSKKISRGLSLVVQRALS
jgi:aminopeptidase N